MYVHSMWARLNSIDYWMPDVLLGVGEWTFNHSVAASSPHLTQQETAGPLSLAAWLSVWGDGDFYDK